MNELIIILGWFVLMERANTWKPVFSLWRIKLSNHRLSVIVQHHWIRSRNFVSVMLFHFIPSKVVGLVRIGTMPCLCRDEVCYHRPSGWLLWADYAEKFWLRWKKSRCCWLGILIILKKKMAINYANTKSEDQNLDVKTWIFSLLVTFEWNRDGFGNPDLLSSCYL